MYLLKNQNRPYIHANFFVFLENFNLDLDAFICYPLLLPPKEKQILHPYYNNSFF